MSKKILASVLAAASILSVSAVASAADAKPGEYNVSANVTTGIVSVTLPTAAAVSTGVFLNPYNVNVGTRTTGKNNSDIASAPFEIANDSDAEDPIKVRATVSVTKVTGVVVKDMSLDKTSVKGYSEDNLKGITSGCDALDHFDPLVDYSAIALDTDKETKVKSLKSGGDVLDASKQKKNIAMWVSGGNDKGSVANAAYSDGDGCVAFLPKGTNSGFIIESVAPGSTGYFAVNGRINPEYKGEWDENKDNVSMSIIIKCMPTSTTPVAPPETP